MPKSLRKKVLSSQSPQKGSKIPDNAQMFACKENGGEISKLPKGFKTIRNQMCQDLQAKGGKISNGLWLSEIKQARPYKQNEATGVNNF